MPDDNVRIQLRCSNCDHAIGTFPEGERVETELICPHCGATVAPPGPVAKIATKLKRTIEKITDGGESGPRR